MADRAGALMYDKVRMTLIIEPREVLIGEETTITRTILANEVNRFLGSVCLTDVTDYSQSAADQGYKDREPYYLEAPDDVNTKDISSLTDARSILIYNSGFTFDSATVLGDALDKTLKIMVGTEPVAYLPVGGIWYTKDENGELDCTGIHIRTVDNDKADNASAGSLAVIRLINK